MLWLRELYRLVHGLCVLYRLLHGLCVLCGLLRLCVLYGLLHGLCVLCGLLHGLCVLYGLLHGLCVLRRLLHGLCVLYGLLHGLCVLRRHSIACGNSILRLLFCSELTLQKVLNNNTCNNKQRGEHEYRHLRLKHETECIACTVTIINRRAPDNEMLYEYSGECS